MNRWQINDVAILFHEINESCFDGMLEIPYFYISDFEWHGQYWYDCGAHHIAIRNWHSTHDELKGTVAHEMVHQWQKQTGKKVKHGKKFKKKAKKVEKLLGVTLYDR